MRLQRSPTQQYVPSFKDSHSESLLIFIMSTLHNVLPACRVATDAPGKAHLNRGELKSFRNETFLILCANKWKAKKHTIQYFASKLLCRSNKTTYSEWICFCSHDLFSLWNVAQLNSCCSSSRKHYRYRNLSLDLIHDQLRSLGKQFSHHSTFKSSQSGTPSHTTSLNHSFCVFYCRNCVLSTPGCWYFGTFQDLNIK